MPFNKFLYKSPIIRKLFLYAVVVVCIAYFCWELYWFINVGLSFVKWHTYVMVLVYLCLFRYLLGKKTSSPFLSKIDSKFKNVIFFVVYILLSLKIGEIHPFSRVPMYDSLPNWSYVFYAKDNHQNILFTQKNFSSSIKTGLLAHRFYSYCDIHHISYGSGKEDPFGLKLAGRNVLDFMLQEIIVPPPPNDTIFLVRKNIYFNEKNSLVEKDEVIAYQAF